MACYGLPGESSCHSEVKNSTMYKLLQGRYVEALGIASTCDGCISGSVLSAYFMRLVMVFVQIHENVGSVII